MIGMKTRDEITRQVESLIEAHLSDLDHAYDRLEGALSISMTVKIKPADIGEGNDIETSLTFVADKVKDMAVGRVDERQMTLEEA